MRGGIYCAAVRITAGGTLDSVFDAWSTEHASTAMTLNCCL